MLVPMRRDPVPHPLELSEPRAAAESVSAAQTPKKMLRFSAIGHKMVTEFVTKTVTGWHRRGSGARSRLDLRYEMGGIGRNIDIIGGVGRASVELQNRCGAVVPSWVGSTPMHSRQYEISPKRAQPVRFALPLIARHPQQLVTGNFSRRPSIPGLGSHSSASRSGWIRMDILAPQGGIVGRRYRKGQGA